MYFGVVRDNRDILRYRGLLTPGQTILDQRNSAFRLALLRLSDLPSSSLGRYASGNEGDPVKIIESNPFMRLFPKPGEINTAWDFYFPYTPQNIDYSDLSDEIAEIPRHGTTPIVTFKSHRLMKVSMEFLIAVPYDGILIDVENSISLLRDFATQSDRSIAFYNMDGLLTKIYDYPRGPKNRLAFFNITELSITARQRNADGKITQAIAKMTLVENKNPNIVVTRVPPFTKKPPKKIPRPTPEIPKTKRVPEITATANATRVRPITTIVAQ